jgi:hypothetical protein
MVFIFDGVSTLSEFIFHHEEAVGRIRRGSRTLVRQIKERSWCGLAE